MTFNVPTDLSRRPVAVIGAGTLRRHIALMFAAHGAAVKIHDRAETQRQAGVDFVASVVPIPASQDASKKGMLRGFATDSRALAVLRDDYRATSDTGTIARSGRSGRFVEMFTYSAALQPIAHSGKTWAIAELAVG